MSKHSHGGINRNQYPGIYTGADTGNCPLPRERNSDMADQKLRKNNKVASPITIALDAIPENFAAVQDWIRDHLASVSCSMRTLLELDMIVEEVFINIANYAYGNQIGKAWVDLFMDA